ncbi:hypothetical protein [Paenibacillus radicibacter]|uniref:hypothetical protein n=1 Tax=Paenibacillus radicibacter TaxID=2972488 RepID=UPI00215958BD|nr:hypothetical protein [Paenibacillus radicibacter]
MPTLSSNYRKLRLISIGIPLLAIVLFVIDLAFIFYTSPFDLYGTLATFFLPPIGFICAGFVLSKSYSFKDVACMVLNVLTFFMFPMYWLLGTYFYGP